MGPPKSLIDFWTEARRDFEVIVASRSLPDVLV